jgi:hypothetical protein
MHARIVHRVIGGLLIGFTVLALIPIVFSLVLSTDGETVTLFGERLHKACAFKARTGESCGSCGLTRAWILTARGQLDAARELHPQGPETMGAYVWVVISFSALIWALYRGARRERLVTALALALGLVLLGLAFRPTLERNIELNEQFPGGPTIPVQCGGD